MSISYTIAQTKRISIELHVVMKYERVQYRKNIRWIYAS